MDKIRQETIKGSVLPDFCRVNMLLMLVLIAELLAFVLALATARGGQDFWSLLGLYSLFILWCVLLSAAMLCLLRKQLYSLNDVQTGFVAFFVIQLVTFLLSLFVCQFLPELVQFSSSHLGGSCDYFRNVGISCIVSTILLRYLYIQSHWKRQIEAEHEARLDALQARMRPHFLFNSLNTIASLIQTEASVAEELVYDLAELFRASMKKNSKLVTLAEEVYLCRQYLNIEQHRLGDRLSIDWQLETVPDDLLIPPLSLQPLLENSIYHGIEKMESGGLLEIFGQRQRGRIVLVVRNSVGSAEIKNVREGNRMALDNLRARLHGCFDGQGQVFISTVDGFYQVRLVFPYRRRR